MITKKIKAVCFGEILYDVFPTKERIGGAPLNVASRLSSMGIETQMISKVGVDERGDALLRYLNSRNIEAGNIFKDKKYSTGIVNVSLSSNGSATYKIKYPSAWDKIEFNDGMLESVSNADVLIYGSLVCRDEISRGTLFKLIKKAKFRVLDFNLRPPYYSKELLVSLMGHADFIKFNDDELFEIAELLGSKYNSLEQNLFFIAKKSNAISICVTKGRHGAVMMHKKKLYYNSGYKVKVKDTVGAGDSFLATLIAKLLQREQPQDSLDQACAMGALVAGKEGANPVIREEVLPSFMSPC